MATSVLLNELVNISQVMRQIETNNLTSDKIRQVIDTLTPEEHAIWEQIAPIILDSSDVASESIPSYMAGWAY